MEDEEERYEGDNKDDQEDKEMINWADSGMMGYIDPASQFEFDDDVEREYHTDPYPWYKVLSKWRPRLLSAWRAIKHWLFLN